MIYDQLAPAPPDAILGLTEAFKKDPNPAKVNLGVGVYQDDQGVTPIMPSVKAAEERLLASEKSKTYQSISGAPEYKAHVQALLFGPDHAAVQAGRVRTAHTPGGTGGLRVGAEFLKQVAAPGTKVWVSTPTWANHPGIFSAAGFEVVPYPYYHAESKGLDFAGMVETLDAIPAGDIVLLHVCCHNPTGVDLSRDQWREVATIAGRRGWFPFLDFAYQGLGDDLENDRAGLLAMVDAVPELFVASSFSKNFGLYRDRTGALSLLGKDTASADAAFSHVEKNIRVIYSNPPAHGGLIVTAILNDPDLRAQWDTDVREIRDRIRSVRSQFVKKLKERGVQRDFSFIEKQKGMFSFSGLTDEQVQRLREEKSIYIVKGGRINVAGITSAKMDYLCDAIAEVL